MANQWAGTIRLFVSWRGLGGSIRPPCHRPGMVQCWGLWSPLQSVDLRPLMLKTTQLQAIASVKRMGDLQALSVNPSCLEFGPNDSKIVLKPRHGYILKVLSTPFRAQVITLSALPPSAQDQGLNLLCPVRALRIYIERSALGSRNNSFYALAATPRGFWSQSRDYPDG